jgi:predicted house-cleaning NTP pyrophosphatase (Maf/HAM1 superfamily)
MNYLNFLESKIELTPLRGMESVPALSSSMFPYQRDVTEFLLRAGCGAAFLDTGLGKSLISLEWGRVVHEHTGKPVLMLAPLAVSHQHVREAAKFGLEARVAKCQDDIGPGVNVTNYERLHHFNPGGFGGTVLDESSIIKSFTGITTRKLMQFADSIPFRLACSATPAPNDHMELGQHSQFLGAMASNEMLSRWFIADQRNMGRYRLKHHGVKSFWAWVASWARCMSNPSDLGYSDEGFILPPLNLQRHVVQADLTVDRGGALFRTPDTSATAIHKEKRLTAEARARMTAEVVISEPHEPWVVWCDTDYEADELVKVLPGFVEVRGSMSAERKEAALMGFSNGSIRGLITKPDIAGFGLNWQHCARTAFVGLSFSYEKFYQALRRFWRFGQLRPVDAHVIMADTENNIWQSITRKSHDHEAMKNHMRAAMKAAHEHRKVKLNYQPTVSATLPPWLKEVA